MLTSSIVNKQLSFNEIMQLFFSNNSPETVKEHLFKLFQCWVVKDCKIKAEISDEEVALFFDQLTDLVAAAYKVHQANRVATNQPGGKRHE